MKHNQMFKKIVAFCLMFSLIFSLYGEFPVIARADSASAAEAADSQLSADSTAKILQPTDSKILNYVDEEVFMSGNHIARLLEEETLSSYVFQNADGSRTVYYLDEAVKFVDSNGVIREKDVSLTATRGGYVTTANDITLTLPDDPASGIRLTYDGHMVSLVPQGGKLSAVVKEGNTVTYPDYYGKGVSLVYTPTLSGVKEDIVLSEYTGVNSFTFMLNTGGLNLYQSNGKFYLAEGKGAVERIDLGQVVTFDAHGRFSIGTMTSETVMAGNLYRLTITVDEAFLLDENTTYPVSIDPTITVSDNITGANAIEDVTVYSGTPNLTANWGYLHAGYYDSTYKVARTLFRLTGLINDDIYQTVNWANISSVEFYIREATGSPGVSVNLHAGSSSWTETGATWNNTHATSWDGEVYATASPSYEAYATYDITRLVQDWKQNLQSGTLGFYLQSTNETSVDKAFYSSEFTTTANRPYVVMTYQLPIEFVELHVGENTILSSDEFSGGTITWQSTDETVATVNSGLVVGVNTGKATIKAYRDGILQRQFIVNVHLKNGVYRIKNVASGYYLGVSNANAISGSSITQQALQSSGTEELAQLWWVLYHGYGEYSLTPMHKLDRAMYYSNSNVTSNYSPYAANDVSSQFTWTIGNANNNQVIRPDSASGSALTPLSGSTAVNRIVKATECTNATSAFQWEFTLTNGIYLAEACTYKGCPDGAFVHVTLNEPAAPAIAISSGNLGSVKTWTITSGKTHATVASNTGVVTGTTLGQETLRVMTTINGTLYQKSIKVQVVSEVVSVKHLYNSTVSGSDEILANIETAMEFLNRTYAPALSLYFISDGDPQLYTDSVESACTNTNGSCDDTTCEDTCENHHKNITRISKSLFESTWEEDHVVVVWRNNSNNIYCNEGDDPISPGDDNHHVLLKPTTLACVTFFEYRKDPIDAHLTEIPIPVVQFIDLEEAISTMVASENRLPGLRAAMAIVLAHEIAHTLGLREVYSSDSIDSLSSHADYSSMFCIMQKVCSDSDTFYDNVISSSSSALCSACEAKLEAYISDTGVYEATTYQFQDATLD